MTSTLLVWPIVAVSLMASNAEPSLEGQVRALFEERCAACHDRADTLDLSVSPSELLGRRSARTGAALVVPGQPARSYLLAKLRGDSSIEGEPMPVGDDPLTDDETALVERWIFALEHGGNASEPENVPIEMSERFRRDLDAAVARQARAERGVAAYFERECTVCHHAGGDRLNLEKTGLPSLSGARSSVSGARLVVPGDVEQSYLWAKLTGDEAIEGSVMPRGDHPRAAEELQVVREWIVALGEVERTKRELATARESGGETNPAARQRCQLMHQRARARGACERVAAPPFRDIFFMNLPTTASAGRRTVQFRIGHRFGRIGTPRGAFGLDAGAVMSLGVALGLVDGLDVVVRRTNSRKGYELGVKLVPAMQEYGAPVSVGGYASIEYFRADSATTANPVVGNAQLFLSRMWADRWSTQLLVGYHLRTNHASAPSYDFGDGLGAVPVNDTRGSLTVGFVSQLRLGKCRLHSLDVEYLLPVPVASFYWDGALTDTANIGAWALGWTGVSASKKHVFKLFLTNTREIHSNQVAPGGQTRNPFPRDQKYPFDFFLGFSISRRWGF